MVEYSKVNVKLSDTQLKKLKTTVKNKTGTTENEFENAWWKWPASRVIADNKTKNKAKKYI